MIVKIYFHPYYRNWVALKKYDDPHGLVDAYIVGERGYWPNGYQSIYDWCIKMGWVVNC